MSLISSELKKKLAMRMIKCLFNVEKFVNNQSTICAIFEQIFPVKMNSLPG